MGDLIQFVDSISASPTVRLNINEANGFNVKKFNAPPPRLRRSMAQNALRDGITVGAASYDSRTLTLEMESIRSTQDAAAIDLQKLWRELDRVNNWLMYQPNGLTKPVFFRTYRSDTSALEDVMAQNAMRSFTVEILAEPFALGLKETLGPYTVNNDPAAGSNGCYATLGTVLGDVPANCVLRVSDGGLATTLGALTIGQRTDAIATNLFFVQAESLTLVTDTSNPGGGPDAAMSGTGTNNYVTTTFATTATMTTRLNAISGVTVRRGRNRVLAVIRRSDATSVMSARYYDGTTTGDTVNIPLTTSRQIVDLGVWDARSGWSYSDDIGYTPSGTDPGTTAPTLTIEAARTSGTGNLQWDCLIFVPADTSVTMTTLSDVQSVIDGVKQGVFEFGAAAGALRPRPMAGGFPLVYPNAPNRLTLTRGTAAKTATTTVYVDYWPCYVSIVRPVSS